MSREVMLLILILPLPAALLLDALLGDPIWLYHPVRLIGSCISRSEKLLRGVFPATEEGERTAGLLLAALLPFVFFVCSGVVMFLLMRLHPLLWAVVEIVLCYQLLAMRGLRDESMAVYRRLAAGDLSGSRTAVARIVGRDTAGLDAAGVVRATVETVAENTSDGVIAPMLYMAVGGAPLALWYKSINTLDSMVGYKNICYINFGRASALLDDAANYLPARLASWLMILAAGISGFDSSGARRIYLRDRRNHASPNSAHTEAVCAGALGIRLGGDAAYFGKLCHKPSIGDDTRSIEPNDIPRTVRLMVCTSVLSLIVCCLTRFCAAALMISLA